MKIHQLKHLFKTSLVLFLMTSIYSCTPSATGSGRKKMPDFNSSEGIEGPLPFESRNIQSGTGSFAFTTSNVDMMANGNMQEFVSVPLPDAANDSMAVNLVNSFKPFALPLLTAWAQQQRRGVVLDLSNHGSAEVYRTSYVIEKENGFSIPVVIIWDQISASRVATLKAMVEGVSAVKFNCTEGFDPASKKTER